MQLRIDEKGYGFDFSPKENHQVAKIIALLGKHRIEYSLYKKRTLYVGLKDQEALNEIIQRIFG